MIRLILYLSFFLIVSQSVSSKPLYFGAPNKIIDWKISCKRVDPGSIEKEKNNWTFKTSKNYCVGGDWKQRAEIISRNLTFSKKADIYYRLKRLIDKNYMGDLFKVMLITNKKINFKVGF